MTTLWVSDTQDRRIFAYNLAAPPENMDMNMNTSDAPPAIGDRIAASEISLIGDNSNPQGIWANSEHMWVADSTDKKIYVYSLVGGHTPNRDLDLRATNSTARGLWSDGGSKSTIWLVDRDDSLMYGYSYSRE